MTQNVKSFCLRTIDAVHRFLLSTFVGSRIPKSLNSRQLSDSEKTSYVRCIGSIASSQDLKKRFRRVFMYREIVETVSYAQGKRYLDRLNTLNKQENLNISSYALNDLIGKPITYKYSASLKISPTTLRYLSVSSELREIFGNQLGGSFVEIGAGYGGQAAILMKDFNVTSYSIFDLPDAQLITKYFLEELQTYALVKMCTLSDNAKENYDFVISNYAFSELPREIQDLYITQVLQKSKRGYLIMNSGLSDITGRQNGKHTLTELKEKLPPFDVYEESPSTGPDNYVIVWGHEKSRNPVV